MQRCGGDEAGEAHGLEPCRVQIMTDDERPSRRASGDERGASPLPDPDTRVSVSGRSVRSGTRGGRTLIPSAQEAGARPIELASRAIRDGKSTFDCALRGVRYRA